MFYKKILQLRIRHHWHGLQRCRQKLNQLYEAGEPLSSAKMVRIGSLATQHGMKLTALDRRYEDILLKPIA